MNSLITFIISIAFLGLVIWENRLHIVNLDSWQVNDQIKLQGFYSGSSSRKTVELDLVYTSNYCFHDD